jgi:hypothetical protein
MDLFLLILQTLPAGLESSRIIAQEHIQFGTLLKSRNLDQLPAPLDCHVQDPAEQLMRQFEGNPFIKSLCRD